MTERLAAGIVRISLLLCGSPPLVTCGAAVRCLDAQRGSDDSASDWLCVASWKGHRERSAYSTVECLLIALTLIILKRH
jgi:hypothetical protein